MLTALIILNVISLILLGGITVVLAETREQLRNCSDAVVKLQKSLELPMPGAPRLGRTWPTFGELEAARNRMDILGLAHAGKGN